MFYQSFLSNMQKIRVFALFWKGVAEQKEVKRVKKMIIIAAGVVAVLSMLFTAVPAYASPPVDVSGTFSATRTIVPGSARVAGNNLFLKYTGVGSWTGGISCQSTSGVQEWTMHFDDKQGSTPPAKLIFVFVRIESTFTNAIVGGRTGDLRIEFVTWVTAGYTEGTWRIQDATGGLKGLHGEGTCWKNPSDSLTSYEGQVHFDP